MIVPKAEQAKKIFKLLQEHMFVHKYGAITKVAAILNMHKQQVHEVFTQYKHLFIISDVVYKKCRICEMELPLDCFDKNKQRCKDCVEFNIQKCSVCGSLILGKYSLCNQCNAKRVSVLVNKTEESRLKFRIMNTKNTRLHYWRKKHPIKAVS